ncbi:MAG: nucleotidyltransferase domain-containing protein [Deltaproteobacteria bacterium]|nr:nucleotidyltransferase domain-containing protein [Deltaproteobacteria bacterium]
MATNWVGLCFCPDVKFRIIHHFIQNPDLRQNQTQLARAIRRPAISISRNIHDLVKLRILHEERHGKAAVYSLNRSSGLVSRFLTQVVTLNAGFIPDWVEQQVEGLAPSVKKFLDRIVLFGSAARGELSAVSDIDLLALVSRKSEALEFELRSSLVGNASEAGLKINLHVESVRDFDSPRSAGYLRIAKAEGIVLWRK